jgi:hypothetical protein
VCCPFGSRLAAEQRAKRGTSTRRPSIEAKGVIAPQGSDGAVNLGHRLSQKTQGILLANSEAPKCRPTHDPSEGTEAWSTPCGNLGFVGGEIGSPTVSQGLLRQCRGVSATHVHGHTMLGEAGETTN